MAKLVLGIDIGITSVGYGLYDNDSNKIVDAGVRLFEEGTPKENQNRRQKRSSRRLKRRRKFRIYRLKQLLKANGILDESFSNYNCNPYEARCKGLHGKLNNNELCVALLHIAKLRGNSLEIATDSDSSDEGKAKSVIKENSLALKNENKFVCEIQLERFEKNNKIRGSQNIFKTSDYIKEVRQILSNQDLSSELCEKIVEIISSKRHFSEGPGGPNSPTKYGRYLTLNQTEPINLIEKMRGKCSIFKDEPRAAINSYTYCLYNLYNDLNNLTLADSNHEKGKITPEEKDIIINEYINAKGTITLKEISKITSVPEEFISGYRIDKNEKPIFTEFKGYNAIRKCIKNEGLNRKLIDDKTLCDRVIEILTGTKDIEERKENILDLDPEIDEKDAIVLANISGISNYGFLSYKALKLFIDEMKDGYENQMQISARLKLNSNDENGNIILTKTIPCDIETLTNPVVVRAYREAVKVINKIRSQYGELDSIVVEMAREKNSDEEKKAILDFQKRNAAINAEIDEKYASYFSRMNGKTRLKLRLAQEQNWKSPYSQKKIGIEDLLNDVNGKMFEIDHILSLSLSGVDSFNNKVLVYADENQAKGQRTPFQYFMSGAAPITYEQFKAWVLCNEFYKTKDRKDKLNNLLFEGDFSDPEVQKKFIERNLVDTRYASRLLLNNLQSFFKYSEINTKVFTIRGSITDQFRKKAKLEKNRDYYEHHAVDALIMSIIRNSKFLIRLLEKESWKERHSFNYSDDKIVIKETGEVIENDIFDFDTMKKIGQIKDYAEKIKYSWKVDRKVNRSLSDETICGTRVLDDKEYVIRKYKDIYDKKTAGNIVKLFKKGEAENKLLAYRYDKQTFDLIKKIIDAYPNEDNPFLKYKEEHGPIRKYSKKGNGPLIKSLKYVDGALGAHIDISHNYIPKNNKHVVLLQIKPWRMDLYIDNGAYKFIALSYQNVKFKGNKYYIDENWYNSEKERRKISPSAEFLYSFYTNEFIEIVDENDVATLYRFSSVNNQKTNQIEVKNVSSSTKGQILKVIGRKTKKVNKYHVDVLGNVHQIAKEPLTLEGKIDIL